MVSAVESEEEHRLAESLIKEMSGQDRVSARKLFEASFEYVPQFKLIIVCNHKPTMRGDDPAVWRRVRLVPFECVFPVNERNKKLIDRLKTELPGILRWALAGCLDWQKRGLAEPEKITKVTSEYRGASDVFQLFLDECCERGDHDTTASRLYTVYTTWVKANGHRAMSSTKLSLRLQDRGVKREKRSGEIYYTGLGVRPLWLKVAMESKST
jgi:putative DNA primase/helicase